MVEICGLIVAVGVDGVSTGEVVVATVSQQPEEGPLFVTLWKHHIVWFITK